MKLIVDIGNSNIVIGIQQNQQWKHFWRINTQKKASEYHYSLKINNLLWEASISPSDIDDFILSTVVPELKTIFNNVLYKLNRQKVLVLDKSIYPKLNIKIPNPNEMGTDLVANALAVHNKYFQNNIIIDFGTALTFTIVNKKGEIIGVNIAPGIKTAINALSDKASQLEPVPLELPDNPIGYNTQTAIQNGVLIGYVGLVSHMIKVIQKNLGHNYTVIATGGLSEILSKQIPQIKIINKNLTLEGLALLPMFIND